MNKKPWPTHLAKCRKCGHKPKLCIFDRLHKYGKRVVKAGGSHGE